MATLSPEPFRMGAGEEEADTTADEGPVTRTIPRTFSIATKEVTAGRLPGTLAGIRSFPQRRLPQEATARSISLLGDVAIAFCRRLSEREEITEEQNVLSAGR